MGCIASFPRSRIIRTAIIPILGSVEYRSVQDKAIDVCEEEE